MRAEELIKRGKKTLVAARDNFSWSGDEEDQATDLLAHVLGDEPDPGEIVSTADARRFERLIARRAKGEPIPYIVGWTEFRDIRMAVRPGVFVPRATSEFMAGEAIKRLRRRNRPVAVELACGIGPVALSIAHAIRTAEVHAVDISATAITQGRKNARSLGLRNATFYTGDLFGPLPARIRGRVDVITIHPPYIPRQEVRTLPKELRDFEPGTSLTDGSRTGMRIIERVAAEAPDWLRAGSWLMVEVDSAGARPVRTQLLRAGFRDVRSLVGRWRFSRVVIARTGRP